MVVVGNLFTELTVLHSLRGVGQQIPLPNVDMAKRLLLLLFPNLEEAF